jgi:hypothetical protein
MPGQAQRQELIVVNLIGQLQTKVETLSGIFGEEDTTTNHINEYAFNELSKMNAELHNSVKGVFDRLVKENDALRQQLIGLQEITNGLTSSNWYHKNNPDLEYMGRQVLTRAQKQNNPNFKKCDCGEWISKAFFSEHKKRAKCVDSLMRLWYDKNSFTIPIDKMLLINSAWSKRLYYNFKKNGSYNPYGIYCLEKLMRKKYLRRNNILEPRLQLHHYVYKTRSGLDNISFIG